MNDVREPDAAAFPGGMNSAGPKRNDLAGLKPGEGGLKPAAIQTIHLTLTPFSRYEEFNDASRATLMLHIFSKVCFDHEVILHEAAIMPEHVHLLLGFQKEKDIRTEIIGRIKGASSRYFLQKTKDESGKLWGKKYRYNKIESEPEFEKVLQYIRSNPKSAGINSDGRILSEIAAGFSPHVAGFIPQRKQRKQTRHIQEISSEWRKELQSPQ